MFWHTRLGEILSGGKASDRAARPSSAPRTVVRGPSTAQTEAAWDPSRRAPEADLDKLFESLRRSASPTQPGPAEAVRPPVLM
jgi:hypothetical protein